MHDVLNYPWDEVHEEAERLEHFISERFEDRVAALLGDPQVDPHGHVIPRKHRSAPFPDAVPLVEWPTGKTATVKSINDRDSAALRELRRLELGPDVAVVVERRIPESSVLVRIAGRSESVRMSSEVAGQVLVVSD